MEEIQDNIYIKKLSTSLKQICDNYICYMNKPCLYLIPVPLGETEIDNVLPIYNKEIISIINYFIVENIRTARRFLKKSNPDIDIDKIYFFEINKHTKKEEIPTFLEPIKRGHNIGILSEAGCPAIADPGSEVVALAQKMEIKIVPLIGPSSILLALMASGFNGQSFVFHGYLPINEIEKIKKIKKIESDAYIKNQSQIFIETPYRNDKLALDIINTCRPSTRLCLAINISCEDEYIVTKTIKEWKNSIPEFAKRPCVFIIYKDI